MSKNSKRYSVQELPFDAEIYDTAMKMPVVKYGTQTDLFGDEAIILYT